MSDIYFSTSEKHDSWDQILPSLRLWVLEGGTDTPLSDPYTLVSEIRPSNYDGGMLDGVRRQEVDIFQPSGTDSVIPEHLHHRRQELLLRE